MNGGQGCEEKVQTGFTASLRECNFDAALPRAAGHRRRISHELPPVSLMPSLSAVRLVALLLFAASATAAGDAMAQRALGSVLAPLQRGGNDRADRIQHADRRHDRSSEQRALSAAVRRVESQTGGQVLSAERIPFDGREVSRIKVVDASGRVRIYMDDPSAPRARDEALQERSRTRDDDN